MKTNLKSITGIVQMGALLIGLSGCTANELPVLKSVNSSSAGNQGAAVGAHQSEFNEFCTLTVPDQISQDQELRVLIASRGVTRVQVSVDTGDFGDFETVNGLQRWDGGLFAPGSYRLRFRARKADGQVVVCDPVSTSIKVTAVASNPPSPTEPTLPSVPTVPSVPNVPSTPTPPPTAGGQTYPSYQAVVASQGKSINFKTLQNPQNLISMNIDGTPIKVLDYEAIATTVEQLKFFFPPGTVAFDANFYHFLAYQDGKGALRLHSPPTTNIAGITASSIPGGGDYSNVLSKLIAGGDVLYYTQGAPANFLLLSSPSGLSTPLSSGGYVYANFKHPGGQYQRSLWKIYVKASCYEKWFNSVNTQWDANGNPAEGASHTCQ